MLTSPLRVISIPEGGFCMPDELELIQQRYETTLNDSILTFWIDHGYDRTHAGMLTGLDRDGSILETDKSVWFQGRSLWTFSTAYNEFKRNPVYLEVASSCASFLEQHCFDTDGRMFFRVTIDGKPVVKRIRYIFSETFAVIGFASYSRASGQKAYAQKALALFRKVLEWKDDVRLLIPKFMPETRASRHFGLPMILLNTAQELRKACPEEEWLNTVIDDFIKEIRTYFVRPELELVLEQCALDGSLQADHFEGRLLNPGHAIEGAWFILNEARYRNNDADLIRLGCDMLDWMWNVGWDTEYGGLFYVRDALKKSLFDYWHDMKFWWPHNEAIIANLTAYSLTGATRYLDRFYQLDSYVHTHFADKDFGEWFGYLHRDGSVSTQLKGNMFKGPFHIPRMYLACLSVLNR